MPTKQKSGKKKLLKLILVFAILIGLFVAVIAILAYFVNKYKQNPQAGGGGNNGNGTGNGETIIYSNPSLVSTSSTSLSWGGTTSSSSSNDFIYTRDPSGDTWEIKTAGIWSLGLFIHQVNGGTGLNYVFLARNTANNIKRDGPELQNLRNFLGLQGIPAWEKSVNYIGSLNSGDKVKCYTQATSSHFVTTPPSFFRISLLSAFK